MSQSKPTEVQINAYAENYVLYGENTKAFRAAFPDTKGTMHTVNTKASKFNKIEAVQARVVEIRSNLKKQTEEEFNVTVSDLKKMLIMAAQGGLVKKRDAQMNNIMHNIAGSVSAISEINRMDGNHAPSKQDHMSSDGSMSPAFDNDKYKDAQDKLKDLD